jgi:hypothetical protein
VAGCVEIAAEFSAAESDLLGGRRPSSSGEDPQFPRLRRKVEIVLKNKTNE